MSASERVYAKADRERRDDNVVERLNETDIYDNSVSHGNNRLHGISILINRFNLYGTSFDYFDKAASKSNELLEYLRINNN